ncbi:ethanolamine utilization protein [Citrobacter freundii]|nr:ethanolamine utilization protein [Citrobacter freundii]
MAEIVAHHIAGKGVADLWLAGGACMQPGVDELFRKRFPELQVHLPQHSLFMTPLAIANSGKEKSGRNLCKLNCRPRSFRHSIP